MSRLDSRFRILLALREKAAQSSATADADKKELVEYETDLWSELEDLGLKSTTIDLGEGYGKVRVTRRSTRHSRILNKEALVEELRARGLEEEMLRPEPRKKVLNEYVRTLQETGEPLPEGLDWYDSKGLTVTRLK